MAGSFTFADAPDVLAFYSYATSVSIELPVGFRAEGEDGESATYAMTDDDDETVVARVQVRRVGRLDGDATAAVHSLADGFAGSGEVLDRRELTIDGLPAASVVVRRDDGWVLHQGAIGGDGLLLSVVGMASPEVADELVPKLDTALASVRVVQL
jgi:hypothetical protein